MANLFENKDRRVVPNWRSFKKTTLIGELEPLHNPSSKLKLNLSIEDYITDWKENKTIAYAGDLISAALVNGVIDNPLVIDAANFIINNNHKSTYSQVSVAKKIITQSISKKLQTKLEHVFLDDFQSLLTTEPIKSKIHHIKKALFDFPYNPILYVELSRNYSILGQEQKAILNMKIALQLAPENRFVLRCAVRLFAHYDDLEFAHDLVRKSRLTDYDPWLTSAEIAMATLRDRTSRFMKKGIEMVNSKNFSSFNITELASSLGTVELLSGNQKKSRNLFNIALKDPNDNSLAQAEWASSKNSKLNIKPIVGTKLNFEAIALDHFSNAKYTDALDNIARWFLDMPFSKRPVMFGSHIANSFLNDPEKSRNFLKAGLISHPHDPQLINNIVYSLALENKVEEANEYLNRLSGNEKIQKQTEICLMATKGLVYFRSGLADPGRKLYLKAIAESQSLDKNNDNDRYFNWLAVLNYAREEFLIKSEYVESVLDAISHIPDKTSFNDINKLKRDVVELYKKQKETTI